MCNAELCPANCTWSQWGSWGPWSQVEQWQNWADVVIIEARTPRSRTRVRDQIGGEHCNETDVETSPERAIPFSSPEPNVDDLGSAVIAILILLG